MYCERIGEMVVLMMGLMNPSRVRLYGCGVHECFKEILDVLGIRDVTAVCDECVFSD